MSAWLTDWALTTATNALMSSNFMRIQHEDGGLNANRTSQGHRFRSATRLVPDGPPVLLRPGEVEAVGPRIGDVHRVRNAFDDRVSISIHVYGGDIGDIERSTYLEDGTRQPFVSGYSPSWTPAVPLDRQAS